MSVKSSIQVCIKVRPVEPGQTVLWQVKEERSLQLIDGASEPCAFDYVFDQDCNNQKIFDCMASHIVEACIKGFNGTIFAYGQTSSGKTYTMMGDERNPGVMVLAVKEIFKQIAKQTDRDFLLRVGYIEIYNEKICDLLNKKNQDLKIHESSGMVNVNCEECIITSEEDMLRLLCLGNKERTVGETNMNERSSRSHAIFRIIIESRVTGGDADGAVNQSLLHLVDLAGSERADQTGARGARLKEGGHINKSLHFLSNVIKQLSENIDNRYICYRESKLTRILQASLGGNAFTSIICTIKPSIVEESNSTLSFAMRAKKIKLKPQLNENVSDATMMRRLERQIKTLEGQLAEEKRRNESQVKVSLLEQRIKTDTLKIISSHSLIDQRNRNRRRTWCPASTNLEPLPAVEASAQHKVSNLPKPTFYAEATEANLLKFSNLPKPSFYAGNVHPRIGNAPKTINIMKSLDIAEEEFKPAELHEFGQMPDSMISSQIQLTLTPCPEHLAPQNREKFERELIELQTFSKIEQHINTEWEDLTQKLTTATDKINELQNERADFTKRSDDLQAKVDSYEAQLSELKQTVQRLEMENRAAVDIEFQYESHKTRAERRESELLSAISEKESELLCIIAEKEHFQQTLNELSSEMLRNSKDAHMRSMCPDIESSCEQICNKCQELERMLEEYKQAQSNGKLAAQEKIECECEQLRVEIENTRARLESVQLLYEQMSSDVNERTERCERLSRDVVTAEQCKQSLQAKYVELEQSQQRQEAAWQAMQKDYEAIQLKYAKLQQDYALLERNTALCEQLQQQNEQLQQEISRLKQRVEQVQQQLLQAEEHKEQQTLAAELRARNEELLEKLQHIQAKFDDMQKEYDALSNDLMESVQEGDNLREQCTTLAAQLQQQQQQQAKPVELLTRLQQLEQEISAKNQLIESTECTIQEMREQMKTLEDALLEKSFIVSQVEDYKQQIETLEKHKAEMTLVCEELQEKVKENTINESLQLCNNNSQLDIKQEQLVSVQTTLYNMNGEVFELQAELKQQLSQLGSKNELIQRQQTELAELNERCISMDVQQVELQANVLAKQQQLDRQAEKSALDRTHIDELQACKAQLEETVAQLEQQLKQFQNMELQQQHKAELDAMQLDYLDKIEQSESSYRENLRKYNLEWKESKTEYEQRLEQLRMENAAFVEQLHALESEQKQQMSLERTASVENLKAAESKQQALMEEKKKNLEQLQAMETERNELLKKNEQLEASVENLKAVETKLNELVEEKKKLQLSCEENVQQLKALETERNELEASVENLKAVETKQIALLLEHEKSLENLQALEIERVELLEKNKQLEESVENLKALETKLNELLEEKQKLQLSCEENVQQLKAWETERDELLQKNKQLEESVENLKALETKLNGLLKEKKQLELRCEENVQQLKALETERNELEASVENLKALETKQIALLMEHEKCLKSLQAAQTERDESVENFKALETKLNELLKEKDELELRYKENHKLLEQLQAKLDLSQARSQPEQQLEELQEKLQDYEQLKSEQAAKLAVLQLEKIQLSSALEQSKQSIQRMQAEQKIKDQLILAEIKKLEEDHVQMQTEMYEKVETLNSKANDMQLKVEKNDQKFLEFAKRSEEQQQLQLQLTEAKALNSSLQQQVDTLNQQMQTDATLQAQLQALEQQKQQAALEQSNLSTQLQQLQAQMTADAAAFERQLLELQGACAEQQLKLDSFAAQKLELEATNHQLTVKLKNALNMQTALDMEQQRNKQLQLELQAKEQAAEQLQQRLAAATTAESKQLAQLSNEVNKLTTDINKQRVTLKNFELERAQMSGTINSLLQDKRDLEEKLCATGELLKKLELDLKAKSTNSSSNTSFESNASASSPTLGRRSLERDAVPPRKSLSYESEVRRNRRISTHDERRRQSYWNDTKHVAIMTDPVDNNCNCAELDLKLKDCQRELYIEKSKVVALNIELRNHPLKDENALLKKRLQDEQAKSYEELKRFKHKLSLATAAKPSSTISIQTDGDYDKELSKLNAKLADSLTICRSRYKQIIALEERLKQFESSDATKLAAATAEEINDLKAQVAQLQKDYSTLVSKYDLAKRALKMRRDEINELRLRVGNAESDLSD